MTKQYSISEARANLPAIIDEAEAGNHIQLTRHGRPVAVLISNRELQKLTGESSDFMQAYYEVIKEFPLKDWGVDEGFAESLRDPTTGREVNL